MKSGIYLIEQISTGYTYVGSAVDMPRRWHRHKSDLKSNRHHNSKLQRAWGKYGEDDFKFSELEQCDTSVLIDREQFWMNNLTPYFNILKNAYSASGFKHTEEAKKKMSEISKTRWKDLPEEEKKRRSSDHAEKLRGRKLSEETRRKISESNKSKVPHPNSLRNLKEARLTDPDYYFKAADARAKIWYTVTSDKGVEHHVRNLSKFCRENALSQSHLVSVAKGKRKTHKGWKCKYLHL